MNFAGGRAYDEGRSLLRQMTGIAKSARAEFKAANVVEVSGEYPEFIVKTDTHFRAKDKNVYKAKTILFATGTARKHPKVDGLWRKWLPLANVGNGAFYCPDCEAPLVKDKDVLVVNTGTVGSAIHTCNAVSRFTDKVRLLMTEDAYVPIESQDLSRLDDSPYPWVRGKIKTIEYPIPGKVQRIILESGEVLRANVFFTALVDEPRSDLAQMLGVDVDQSGNIITDKRGKTNIEGVWAAGDVRPITQQIAMAVGTGNYAALMINQFLGNDHEKEKLFDHPECRSPLYID
jgi:thioredoxin reductase (NADPH)